MVGPMSVELMWQGLIQWNFTGTIHQVLTKRKGKKTERSNRNFWWTGILNYWGQSNWPTTRFTSQNVLVTWRSNIWRSCFLAKLFFAIISTTKVVTVTVPLYVNYKCTMSRWTGLISRVARFSLVQIFQNEKKYTKRPKKCTKCPKHIPKSFQMAVKCTKYL
jgi:hypothetical protein